MTVTDGQGQSPWTSYTNQQEHCFLPSKARKIRALRNLAERPGTEEEGKTAKRFLEKLLGGWNEPGA